MTLLELSFSSNYTKIKLTSNKTDISVCCFFFGFRFRGKFRMGSNYQLTDRLMNNFHSSQKDCENTSNAIKIPH